MARAAAGEKKTTRTRPSLDTRRAQLIAQGMAFFGTRPYDTVSIDDIAEAAGISKGMLYHYFPTKRDYYAAVSFNDVPAGKRVRQAAPRRSLRRRRPPGADAGRPDARPGRADARGS